ncbi:MFS transporter [Bacteroides graminisolvens]|uniref:MFS transporter n=1 Tax=Bacteroides graminisolvens TaxID=477666 RepID=UPI0023F3C72D|nr:MFS transporter [Bacteroides graminisolvens]MDD3211268.1 MFS transporter [Bacteroides graminisolvens]
MSNWKNVFGIIWTGQLFSILSSSIVSFALILWLSFETGSAEVLALSALAALLPQSVIGLVAGVYIDRWDRKRTMIAADSFIAFCTLLLAMLFFLNMAEIWHIYVLLALRSVGSAFHMPAMQASIPLLAPADQLGRIAGINQMLESVCNIAGPALGALFIGLMDISYILLLDVGGALMACLSLLFVRIPNPEQDENKRTGIWIELKEALHIVKKIKGITPLVLFSVLSTFVIMPVAVLFPLMTLKHFSGDAFQMSVVEVAWGAGMLLGGAGMGVFSIKTNKVILINLMYVLIGLSFYFSGILPESGFWTFVFLTLAGGVASSIYNACFITVIQIQIPPHILGRIFSVYLSLALLPSMIGLVAAGAIADAIGLSNMFIISGLLLCLIGLLSFAFRSMQVLGKHL